MFIIFDFMLPTSADIYNTYFYLVPRRHGTHHNASRGSRRDFAPFYTFGSSSSVASQHGAHHLQNSRDTSRVVGILLSEWHGYEQGCDGYQPSYRNTTSRVAWLLLADLQGYYWQNSKCVTYRWLVLMHWSWCARLKEKKASWYSLGLFSTLQHWCTAICLFHGMPKGLTFMECKLMTALHSWM